jgi:hypothetical protein
MVYLCDQSQVLVGISGIVECMLTTKLCTTDGQAKLSTELAMALPDGYRVWAMEHLRAVLDRSGTPADRMPNCVVVAWGRVWERSHGDAIPIRIACFILQAWTERDAQSTCFPRFVACTPEGAVARYRLEADPSQRGSRCVGGSQREAHPYEPRASRFASAAAKAMRGLPSNPNKAILHARSHDHRGAVAIR